REPKEAAGVAGGRRSRQSYRPLQTKTVMSAESVLLFYGLRFEAREAELESLELRKHPLIVNARSSGLGFYWANFGIAEPRYLVFVGWKIGAFGVEGSAELRLSEEKMMTQFAETRTKLKNA